MAGGGMTWFAKSLAEGLPLLIALGAGCALCLLSLRKHTRPALFGLGGGALLLLHFLAGRLWGAFVVGQLYAKGGSGPMVAAGVNLFLNLLMAAGLGLLFYAVFADRER